MFFDHFIRIFPLSDALVPLAGWLSSVHQENLSNWIMSWIPHLFIYFGRVAAPIFMLCIVEGFLHTRNLKRYISRIFCTAIIAQIPYILFHLAENRMYNIAGDWNDVPLNILFTLSLGLLSLWSYTKCVEKGHLIGGLSFIVLAGALARLLQLEGSEGYIFIIFMFYILRNQPVWQRTLFFMPILVLARYRLIAYTLTDFALLRTCLLNVIGPYLGILAICFYSGEQGPTGKRFKWFMYAFYPLHLLILAAIGYVKVLF
nr:TraX family protein [Aminipila butyrica]